MSAALVKISETDVKANFLSYKLTSSDETVSIIEKIVGGESVLDLKAPGGGTPAGIILGLKTTAINYTLQPTRKTIVLVTIPSAIITLPAANTFQEAVEYIIKDISGLASQTNISIQCSPGDSFEGGLTEVLLTEDYQFIRFISDLSNIFLFTSKP